MIPMDAKTKKYLATIGRKGGKRSRRTLTRAESKEMLRVRKARRAYRKHHTQCFWSFDPNFQITKDMIPWVARRLREHGDAETWHVAAELMRDVEPCH